MILTTILFFAICAAKITSKEFGHILPSETSFNPKDLSNLAIWLDANDAATVLKADGTTCNSGDGVQAWKDKSGNGLDVTNQYGTEPILASSVVNGKNVVRFTAIDKLNGSQLKGRNGLGDSSLSYFVVYAYRALHRTYFIDVCFSLGTEFDLLNPYNANTVSGNIGTATTTNDFGTHVDWTAGFVGEAVALNKFTLSNLIYDSANGVTRGYQNGELVGEKVATAGTLPDILILGSWDAEWVNGHQQPYPEYFSDSDIAEVIIYDRALGDGERNQIENYLNSKYDLNLNSIPTTSPPSEVPTPTPSTSQGSSSLEGIANLAIWLDANDAATVLKADGTTCNSGDGVQAWKDKSGNGLDVTNQYGTEPILASSVVNGKNVVRFTAIDKLNGSQLKGRNGLGDSSLSYFVVYAYRALHRTYFIDVCFSLGTEFDLLNPYNANTVSGNIGTATTTNDFGTHVDWTAGFVGEAVALNKFTLSNLIYDSANGVTRGYQNGELVGEKVATAGTLPDILILGSWDAEWVNGHQQPYPEYFSDSDIAEVIIYDRALGDGERNQIENYLNSKYDLNLNSIPTTSTPSEVPTSPPTVIPTSPPTWIPTYPPTLVSTSPPTLLPISLPTLIPTPLPTLIPTAPPTLVSTSPPTLLPTLIPTPIPTYPPTVVSTPPPTLLPTSLPTLIPTSPPTSIPTASPTLIPTAPPTLVSTSLPTLIPTYPPTVVSTPPPTLLPTSLPTLLPTSLPTLFSTASPTLIPTSPPTLLPTSLPTLIPTSPPTLVSTSPPTLLPTAPPTLIPTSPPTLIPAASPTLIPTAPPTLVSTSLPTLIPTYPPTVVSTPPPTLLPTSLPTLLPTSLPTLFSTASPTLIPTSPPTLLPTSLPTLIPTSPPTLVSTSPPTLLPTAPPTLIPTSPPTLIPAASPTLIPTARPTLVSTAPPTLFPTSPPILVPTVLPSEFPTSPPSVLSNSPSSSLTPTVERPIAAPTASGVPTIANTISILPTSIPTELIGVLPTASPLVSASQDPTKKSTVSPTAAPTSFPTQIEGKLTLQNIVLSRLTPVEKTLLEDSLKASMANTVSVNSETVRCLILSDESSLVTANANLRAMTMETLHLLVSFTIVEESLKLQNHLHDSNSVCASDSYNILKNFQAILACNNGNDFLTQFQTAVTTAISESGNLPSSTFGNLIEQTNSASFESVSVIVVIPTFQPCSTPAESQSSSSSNQQSHPMNYVIIIAAIATVLGVLILVVFSFVMRSRSCISAVENGNTPKVFPES
jgi:kynurenine formamidase